jgi:hypothetical protein
MTILLYFLIIVACVWLEWNLLDYISCKYGEDVVTITAGVLVVLPFVILWISYFIG